MRTATYTDDVNDAQVRWGSHDDPRGLLIPGGIYAVESVEVHTNHTKIFLAAFPGKSFNSVWFDIDLEEDFERWRNREGY